MHTHLCNRASVCQLTLRSQLLAIVFVVAIAINARGSIFLSVSNPTYLPDANLISFVLHAQSNSSSQTINGIDTPSFTPISNFGGFHQVWLVAGALTTPTQGDHIPGLWNTAYTPYDSYWFFDSANSISVGAAFNEQNNESGGASGLPSSPVGAPYTGFGTMGTVGAASGAKAFTGASGKQGQDVPLAQLVFKPGELFGVNGTILTNQGANASISNSPLAFDFFYVTHTTITVPQGASIEQLFQAIDPYVGRNIGWVDFQFIGPGTALQPQFNYSSHQINWNTAGSSLGTYTASVQAGSGFYETATLTINVVPEPSCAALLGIALIAGMDRRRR